MLKIMYAFPEREQRQRYFTEIGEHLKKGRRIYLLVPEQQVLDYEDEAMKALPENSPLSFTVASFSLLGEIAERQEGGISYKLLTKPIKSLLMWKAIKEVSPFLKLYRNTSPERLTSLMIECIDEMKSSGITPEALADASHFVTDAGSLSKKLSDISLIFSAYSALTGNKYTDSSDSETKLLKVLREKHLFEGCELYIDSFTDFTPVQMAILECIIPFTIDTTISLPADTRKDLSIQFETVRRTDRELSLLAERHLIEVKRESAPERKYENALQALNDNIWRPGAPSFTTIPGCENIEIFSARDRYEEARTVINLVRRSLYNGDRLSDTVIIARNTADYKKLLASAAFDAGLSLFTSDRETLKDKLFSNHIKSILRILTSPWQREDILTYLKCGLIGADELDIARYELYTTRWQLSGRKQLCESEINAPYNRFSKESLEDDIYAASAERIRKEALLPLLKLEHDLSHAETVKEMLRTLFEYLEESKAREELLRLSDKLSDSGENEDADRCARVYSATVKLFDEICLAIGDDPAPTIRELSSLLELLFSVSDLGSIPTRQDELTLADASLYRSFGHKNVMIIGCLAGEFPAGAKSPGLLARAEKERLESEGLHFAQNAYESASREYMYFWRALRMAKKHIIMTYPEKTGESNTSVRSAAIDKTRILLPNVVIKKTRDAVDDLLYDAYSLSSVLSLYAPESELLEKVNTYIDENGRYPDKLKRVGKSLVSEHKIEKKTADACLPDPITASPTALESYNKCAFAYFCEKLLGIDKGERNEFNFAVSGETIHKTMEHFLSLPNADSMTADEILKSCNEAVRKYYDDICPSHLRDNRRLRLAFERTAISASVLAVYILKDLGTSAFRPAAFEFNTATSGGLKIDADREAYIYGRIDRIDKATAGENSYLRIIDYKSGEKHFSCENMLNGTELQLPAYLSSVTKDNKFLPGGFLYISSATKPEPINSVKMLENKDELYSLLSQKIDASGVLSSLFYTPSNKRSTAMKSFSEEELNALLEEAKDRIKETVNSICRGNFAPDNNAKNKKNVCQYCRYGAICRQKKKN